MNKSSIKRSITVLFMLITTFALVTADLLVSAQNANSSTQGDEQTRGGMMTTQNTNASSGGSTRRRRPRRRPVRRSTMNMNGDMSGNANTSGDMQNTNTADDASANTNMAGDMSGNANMGVGRRRRGRGRRRSNTSMPADTSATMQTTSDSADGGVQTDLAGQSYTGTASYSEGGLNGAATLAFESGNQFTLTPEGGTAMSGRYSAVTTRGYTGVTMMFSGATPPTIVSVRLKKMGRGVSIMSVPGESRQFSFTSTGGGGMATGGGHRRPRRKRAKRGGIKPPMAEPSATP